MTALLTHGEHAVENPPDQTLIRIDRARAMLAEAKTIQAAKQVADVAATAETYLRRMHASQETITQAQELKVRAHRIMGKMLKQTPLNPGTRGQGRPHLGGPPQGPPKEDGVPLLRDVGISKNQSSAAQRLAELPEEAFEEAVEATKEEGGVTAAKVMRRAKQDAPPDPEAEAQRRKKEKAAEERRLKRFAKERNAEQEAERAKRMSHSFEDRFRLWLRQNGATLPFWFQAGERDAVLAGLTETWPFVFASPASLL